MFKGFRGGLLTRRRQNVDDGRRTALDDGECSVQRRAEVIWRGYRTKTDAVKAHGAAPNDGAALCSYP